MATVDPAVRDEVLKDLLRKIFEADIIKEKSYDLDSGRYGKTSEAAALEACDGDRRLAALVELFSYWMNDVAVVGAEFGISMSARSHGGMVEGFVVDVPPKPEGDGWYWGVLDRRWIQLGADDPEPVDAAVESV